MQTRNPICLLIPGTFRGQEDSPPELLRTVVAIHDQVLFSWPADTSSGKSFPRIAFAGCLETLSWQESALGPKIQLSERSKFCILGPAFSRFLQA